MRWAGKICSYTDEIITGTVGLFERKVTNRFLCVTLTSAPLALVTERKGFPLEFPFSAVLAVLIFSADWAASSFRCSKFCHFEFFIY